MNRQQAEARRIALEQAQGSVATAREQQTVQSQHEHLTTVSPEYSYAVIRSRMNEVAKVQKAKTTKTIVVVGSVVLAGAVVKKILDSKKRSKKKK